MTRANFSFQLRRQVVVERLILGRAAAALMNRPGCAGQRRGLAFICNFDSAEFKIRRGRFFLSEGPSDWNVDDHLDEFIFFPTCRQVGCDSLTCSVGHAPIVKPRESCGQADLLLRAGPADRFTRGDYPAVQGRTGEDATMRARSTNGGDAER